MTKHIYLTLFAALVIGTGSASAFDEQTTTVTTMTAQEFSEEVYSLEDLLNNIDEFVQTPQNGVSWHIFGETGQTDYAYTDDDGAEWSGVRPAFKDDLKKLDNTEIIIQGYMFPLDADEKQSTFLFGPFPLSCPYHYHVTPNLIIEVHAKSPISFSYEAVNLKGILELVPQDDYYNVFYRLKNAELVK